MNRGAEEEQKPCFTKTYLDVASFSASTRRINFLLAQRVSDLCTAKVLISGGKNATLALPIIQQTPHRIQIWLGLYASKHISVFHCICESTKYILPSPPSFPLRRAPSRAAGTHHSLPGKPLCSLLAEGRARVKWGNLPSGIGKGPLEIGPLF